VEEYDVSAQYPEMKRRLSKAMAEDCGVLQLQKDNA
jgi:hypothetical protein